MKRGISVEQFYDLQGHSAYRIRKEKGTLTLEEIKQALTERDSDYYFLVMKCMDDDTAQYYDDDIMPDTVEAYSAQTVLTAWERVEEL